MTKYYSNFRGNDGFGAQYQKTVQTYIFCKMHNLKFIYKPLDIVEHNYDNDVDYNNKLENLMNLKNNIPNSTNDMNIHFINFQVVREFVEKNIDVCCNNEHMNFIKKCYWENKDKNFFNNNKFNVAIHIRRENPVDRGLAGNRVTTPNSYYLNIMNRIREKHKDKEIMFHVYSQGDVNNFMDLANHDVKFYINYDIIETFKGLVAANVLVISPSSFSYIAGLLSDGEIYYKPFWHNPKKNWIYK
jgi:hypothetical protein